MGVHIWADEDVKQHAGCSARIPTNPAWQGHIKKILPLIVHQETRSMNPAPFFQSKLQTRVRDWKQAWCLFEEECGA